MAYTLCQEIEDLQPVEDLRRMWKTKGQTLCEIYATGVPDPPLLGEIIFC